MRLIWTGSAAALPRLACGLFLALAAGCAHSAFAADDDIVDAPRATHEMRQFAAPPTAETRNIPQAIDESDAAAALEGIRIALTEVGDGGSYVWHRRDGRLSGMAQPTASFRDASGQPCRHLIVALNTFTQSKKIEGIACRLSDGRWQLAG